MKTLVIHPYDRTTRMLASCYEGKDWTVIADASTSKKEIKQAIIDHDRVIMLGHGTSSGLMGKLGAYNYRFIIDSSYLYLLREKKSLIAVWCNADEFFNKYDLKGFYTGMIISEYDEAEYCNLYPIQRDIDESNNLFGEALTKSIDSDDMLDDMVKHYVGDTPTINFNKVRLYKR